jgi:hypothetical protein
MEDDLRYDYRRIPQNGCQISHTNHLKTIIHFNIMFSFGSWDISVVVASRLRVRRSRNLGFDSGQWQETCCLPNASRSTLEPTSSKFSGAQWKFVKAYSSGAGDPALLSPVPPLTHAFTGCKRATLTLYINAQNSKVVSPLHLSALRFLMYVITLTCSTWPAHVIRLGLVILIPSRTGYKL